MKFGSRLFTQFCELLAVAKKRTAPYHPSANGQVERISRMLLQMIRCTLKEGQADWNGWLQTLMAVVRYSLNNSTGFNPKKSVDAGLHNLFS